MTASSPAPSTRKATSFSVEELQLLDTLFKIMLTGGDRIMIPPHLIRHRAFKSIVGKVSRMYTKSGSDE
jgi:hypothetical protein